MEFDTESGYSDPTGNATDQQAQARAAALRAWGAQQPAAALLPAAGKRLRLLQRV